MATATLKTEKLAIYGGTKAKSTPYGTGERFGEAELRQLGEALKQNTLFYYKGEKVKAFTKKFAAMHGSKYCVAVNSGTAAIHVALSALGVSVGDEVIVPPITDMGSIIGILFQNAIPVFADLDPWGFNLDPASVEKLITPRTKAILAVHLFGSPCDLDALMAVSKKHNIPLVEDCAQAFGARYRDRNVGQYGVFGCFSTNDFKHISTGDGGMVVTSDDRLGVLAAAVADKNYHRTPGSLGRSPEFLAPNYRMTELQGAVGFAQLDRLEACCKRRHEIGERLCALLKGLPGVEPIRVPRHGWSSYLHFTGRIKPGELTVDRARFLEALNAEGVPVNSYLTEPIYEYKLFKNRNIYQHSHFPLEGTGKSYTYGKGLCPVAEEIIDTMFFHTINEFFTDQDVEETGAAFRKVAEAYAK